MSKWGPEGGCTAEPLANAFSREVREAPHLAPRVSTGTTETRGPLLSGARQLTPLQPTCTTCLLPGCTCRLFEGVGAPFGDVTRIWGRLCWEILFYARSTEWKRRPNESYYFFFFFSFYFCNFFASCNHCTWTDMNHDDLCGRCNNCDLKKQIRSASSLQFLRKVFLCKKLSYF